MKELMIQAHTKTYGCCIYTSITVSDDYTINEVVKAIKDRDYSDFRLVNTMKRFVKIN